MLEYRLRNCDGDYRWIRDIGQPIFGSHEGFAGYIGGCFDLTESKIATEQLRRSEGQFRASANQLRTLSRQLVEAEETHRRELARELHDRVGQYLTTLAINLDVIRRQWSPDSSQRVAARIDASARLVEATVEAVHDLMSGLRPPMLDDCGLLTALRWHVGDFMKRTGIHVTATATGPIPRMSPAAGLTLFRVAQEALTNIARHAHAQQVFVALHVGDRTARLDVIDDGEGFDSDAPADSGERRHWGLISMRERSEVAGGTLRVHSGAGHGTHVVAEVQREA